MAAPPTPPPPVEIAVAEVESAGAAVTFRVARPVAVPSDGSPHKTTVTSADRGSARHLITFGLAYVY